MATSEFFDYRRRLIQFLDDCESEKEARKKEKAAI